MSPKMKLDCAGVTFRTGYLPSSLHLTYFLCTCGTAGLPLLHLYLDWVSFFGDVFLHRKHLLPVVLPQ